MDLCNKAAFIEARSDISTVILAGRWPLYATGSRQIGETQSFLPVLHSPAASLPLETQPSNRLHTFDTAMADMFDRLSNAGKSVIILGAVPEIGWHVPSALAKQEHWGLTLPDVPSLKTYSPDQRGVDDDILERLALSRENVRFVPLIDTMCPGDCRIHDDKTGTVLYYDDDHLSAAGSRLILEKISGTLFPNSPKSYDHRDRTKAHP